MRRITGSHLRHQYSWTRQQLKRVWRERRCDNAPLEQSGVWRYRELIHFLDDTRTSSRFGKATRRCCPAPKAAQYGGLDRLIFKHQGFNPTGSFKDNGMTCGASQAMRLGMKRVACVSTGNTSASMAAYASAAGLQPVIFIPHGNISYGKLAQALEYGALTLQVEANFDQILTLVRVLAERLGIYLLNSINPFRIEGQKIDHYRDDGPARLEPAGLDRAARRESRQRLGVRKGAARTACELGFIDRLPRLAVIQAEKSAPFFDYMQRAAAASCMPSSSRRHWPPRSRSATRSRGQKPSMRFALPTASWRR